MAKNVKAAKTTYLMLRVPHDPKPGSVATIEVVASSADQAKKLMKTEREPQAGAEYCLVKVEDQLSYRTTYTTQKTNIVFGGAEQSGQ